MASLLLTNSNMNTNQHKLATGCMLTCLPCCCSCADTRPAAAAYPVYIDGKGVVMQGSRWQRYCRKCHDYYETLALHTNTADSTITSGLPVSATNTLTAPASSGNQLHSNTTDGHPLGTREDVQKEDYESPVFGMFSRAYGRYQEAEAARQAAQEDADIPSANRNRSRNPLFSPTLMNRPTQANQARYHQELNGQLDEARNIIREATHAINEVHAANNQWQQAELTRPHSVPETTFIPGSPPVMPLMYQPQRTRARTGFHRQFYTNPFEASTQLPEDDLADDDTSVNAVDSQTSRPRPAKSEDLSIEIACKVCLEQKVNMICMPCMHVCMCRWCAAIHRNDCRDAETGRWSGGLWKCPICRKQISEVKRCYL